MRHTINTKTFTKFKLDGQINLSQLKSFNSINDEANINSSRNQKYTYSGETTLFEKLTIGLFQERLINTRPKALRANLKRSAQK